MKTTPIVQADPKLGTEKNNQERKVQEPLTDPKMPEKKEPSVKEKDAPLKKTHAEPESE